MPKPTNPSPMRPTQPGARSEHQDTVLLTDAPESSAPVSETPSTAPPRLDLSSSILAALGHRYEVLSEAGHGSMGNVYKARDRETGEIVALKLLKPEIASDQAMMERFKNELLFARRITHKNVCRVHEFNRSNGIAYTSMEFVEGESLRSVLNRFGGLPVRKAVNVALQICSGLKEAHVQGIVHRDLKPENVMIDANGNVKIMDFGIARSMEAATRLTGSMVGTPAYMAPEQVSGKPVDYRTDIYSLGLMLYEMFTGSQALQADTPVAVALKQIRETPPPPHEIEPTIPVPIERAILKCLEKDPSKRFQSIAELEKVLSAPGATGTSPGLAPFAAAATTTPLRIDRPFTSSLSVADAKERHTSPFIWVLLGAFLVVAGLAGARWAKVAKDAEQIPAPPALPAPNPPEFALTVRADQPAAVSPKSDSAGTPETRSTARESPGSTSAEKNAGPADKPSAVVSAPPTQSASAKISNADVFPKVEVPAKKSARQIELEKAPPDVQQRADKAFGETKSADQEAPTTYLWVGRYQREDKAQEVAQKIKTFGLPARSIPRHGFGGDFWIVVTGPFGAKRVSDMTQWLEAQGFRNVHELPAGRQPPKTQPQ
jgi:serine/threonine protein kinase